MLFALQAFAAGLWFVPLGNILSALDRPGLIPFVYATSPLAALFAPLGIAALADFRFPPSRVLAVLATGSCLFLCLAGWVLHRGTSDVGVWLVFQLLAVCSMPSWPILNALVFASLDDHRREFGGIRVWGTIGWMIGGWLLSYVLRADSSILALFAGAASYVVVAVMAWRLPPPPQPVVLQRVEWKDLLGRRAFALLRDRDYRAVLLTSVLFAIPVTAYYPYTPIHMTAVGEPSPAAMMTFGQVTEIVAMLGLGVLLARFRLKALMLCALLLGTVRYSLNAWAGGDVDPLLARALLASGAAFHGLCFTGYFVVAQMFIETRVDPRLRAQGQALQAMAVGGIGGITGAILTGTWYLTIVEGGETARWSLFWGVLAAATLVSAVFFAFAYKGRGHMESSRSNAPEPSPGGGSPVDPAPAVISGSSTPQDPPAAGGDRSGSDASRAT